MNDLTGLEIEKRIGNVPIENRTLLVHDVDDMGNLEFWEKQVEKQDHTIAFREVEGKIKYRIFIERGKGGRF